MGFGIGNTAQGIRNPTNESRIQGPLTKSRNPAPGIRNPDFKTVLDSFTCGEAELQLACEQALLFGQAKRASRERASEGPRKGELATMPYKFSFPPRKPRDSAKRENCHRKSAADYKSDNRLSSSVELFIYKSLSQQHQGNVVIH